MPINQPSNQIKFTNVSVVRLKKGMFTLLSKRIFSSTTFCEIHFFYAKYHVLLK